MKNVQVGQIWVHNGKYCIGRQEEIESGDSVGVVEVYDWLSLLGVRVIHVSDEVVSIQHPYILDNKCVFTRSEFLRCFKFKK